VSAIPGNARVERRVRLAAAMADEGIDILVVAGNPWRSDYLRFAADITPVEGHAFAFIEREGPARIIVEHPAEAARLRSEQAELDVRWSLSAIEETETAIRELGKRRIALARAPRALSSCNGATRRKHRTGDGLARSPHAAEVALRDRGISQRRRPRRRRLRRFSRRGARRAAGVCARRGSRSFLALARLSRELSDSRFRRPEVRGMHPPTERRLAPGDLVTTELTPCVEGYYAQICRTLVLGEPSATQERAYAVYDEALEAGIAAVRAGAKAGDVARAQNEVISPPWPRRTT